MKFRNWLTRFMAGRYGTDQLNRALSIVTLALLLLSIIFGRHGFGSVLWLLALGCLVWSTFRTFSRNTVKRRLENTKYMRFSQKYLGAFKGAKTRFQQRKDYKFFRCPSCKTWLRVPKGKGKLNITCRQCGERFTRNT